jgi:transcriptional regulator with XRE-family HTH domain
MRKRNAKTLEFLDDLAGGPLTFGEVVRAARDLNGISQAELARLLGVGRQSICDIEKGRALVSVEKAAKIAEALNHNKKLFVRLALQDQVAKAGLKLEVTVGDAA